MINSEPTIDRKAENKRMSLTIAVALVLGVTIGLLTHQYGLWIAISVAIGIAVGQGINQQRRRVRS